MRGKCDGEECRCGPAEEERDGLRQKCADPAKVSSYVATAGAVELGVALGRQCAGEEECEE